MDELIRAVSDNMPKFNEDALRNFVNQQINGAPQFIDTVYREATKLVGNAVQYHGFEVLSPFERIEFELNVPPNKKPILRTAVSELQLLRFKFTHGGQHYYTHFYVPYIHRDMLQIRGKRYGLIKGITDQIFSVTKQGGIQVRPIRVLIDFNRTHQFRLNSVHHGLLGSEFVITTKLYHSRRKRQGKKICEYTVLHYLLCKFGFANTILKFGFSPEDMVFTKHAGPSDDADHTYFVAKAQSKAPNDVYLRVRNHVLKTDIGRKFVANVLYVLTHFNFHTVETLTTSTSDFRIMLGRIMGTNGVNSDIKARSDADNHLASVALFIDPITHHRFLKFGLNVGDIYDLLIYVFVEIDRLLANSVPQDLYQKRLDILDGTLVAAYATTIFTMFYHVHQKLVLQPREVKMLFRNKPMAIEEIYSSRRRNINRNVNPSPEIYGDNWLDAVGIHKLRPGGAPQDRFHPSMAVVESIIAFSGSTPGLTGFINPYVPIDQEGGVIMPDYAADIAEIVKYLPSR